ncbi:hypothetical protein FB451DRAFT_1368057 [Mycena latifolia]|nr:hypothetical protein FB451DRAFT_1368057 [Mycena latifolia]
MSDAMGSLPDLDSISRAVITAKLNPREEMNFKVQFACATLQTRRAEADFILSVAAEARAAIASEKAAIHSAKSKVKLLKRRKIEAQKRAKYYSRLFEVATDNLVDAETEARQLKQEADKMGLGPTYGEITPCDDVELCHEDSD